MHALTSSIFIPTILSNLSISERRIFLDLYLLAIFDLALLSGRPTLDAGLLMSYDAYPVAPRTEGVARVVSGSFGTAKNDNGETLPDVVINPEKADTRNPWLSIVESCLYQTGTVPFLLPPCPPEEVH